MSRESTAVSSAAPSAPPHQSSSSSSSQSHDHPPKSASTSDDPKDSSQNNFVEEDDSDFVLVVNRKKNHHVQQQQQPPPDSYRKHRQSYEHGTDDEHHHHNNQGRRRKYRDRGGGSNSTSGGDQKEKGGFRRRDKSHKHHHHDKENINKTGNNNNTHQQQQQHQQTLPTSPPPPQSPPQQQQQQPQISTPSVRSFSLVVACGSSRTNAQPPPLLQNQKSTQTETLVALPNRQISSSLSDQSNDQDSPVRLTNRQILMVMKPKQDSVCGGPSTSSSIPDTSSLTSEETLDSIERKTSADAESNEGSSVNNGPILEYVDAPVPKVNPWVANRNAVHVITGAPVALPGFPSVTETLSDTSPPPPPQNPPERQPPPSQKSGGTTSTTQKQTVKPPAISPTSFSAAVSSSSPPKQKEHAPPAPPPQKLQSTTPELPKKPEPQLPQATSCSPPPPPPPQQLHQHEIQPSVYVREMSNGFRPGRGRGSYSASASAGRKIPSRSSVLSMKVMSSDPAADDWPTLGETVVGGGGSTARAQKISSGEEDAGGEQDGEKVQTEDAVDSHVKLPHEEVKSNEAPRKSPPPPAPLLQESVQKSKASSPPPQQRQNERPPQNQTETTSSSDNDDDINSSNKQRKGSKQRWVPLDMTSSQGGGERGNNHGENHVPVEYKKSGKGKHNNKYHNNPSYYGGYPRAKGKENVAINGVNDYSDYNSHGHHGPGRYSNSRGGPNNAHHRSAPQMNSGRGGSNNSIRRRPPPPHHRSSSTLSLNNHSLINGSHTTHHHATYDIITSPTHPPQDYQDFNPADFTTLTPMYPAAVSEFIMPYVTNGYFPTPLPPGVIVEPGTAEVVGGVPIVVTQSQPTPMTTVTTQVNFPNGDLTVLTDLVRTQIEYYFSEENLAKDFYLRRNMDEQGYLPVPLIAMFPRVTQMTQDYSTVLTAIQTSETLELKHDMSSVRTSVNPEKWPIPDRSTSSNPASSSSSSSGSADPIASKKCINNNNTPSGGGGVETLNPNVPEFVPKSKVASF